MKIHRTAIAAGMFLAAIVGSCLDANPARAQKGVPPGPGSGPTIQPLVPAGIQRGQAVELTITGTQLANPTGASLGIPAKITIPTDGNNGKDAGKFKLRIEAPADTPLGWYPFRVATKKGISNMRVLCVDDVPQIAADGKNRSRTAAQEIPVPGAVTGAVLAEQGDYYKFTAKAGQHVSFDCQARRIGSAIDAFMYLYDAKSMRELAYDNDSPGCQSDPRISYTFKEAGEYIVEVKDVLNRGGPDYFYRLRVGDFPLATTPIPMAAKRGTKARITFAGPAVADALAAEIDVPADPARNVLWIAPKGKNGLSGWPVPLTLSNHEEGVEVEPNDNPKQASRIAVPGGITGRFLKGGDTDFYVFAAKKGQKIAIEARTLEDYSPSLVYMVLRNAKGADLAKSNPALPHPADQRLDFTADDGDYFLEVQHLSFAGGPSETYRITIRPSVASFDLVLPGDRFDVGPGESVAIPVQVVRKGYTGPIELAIAGAAPGITGKGALKANQNAALLLVSASPDVPMGAYQFHVVGLATIDGQKVTHVGSAKAAVVQALAGLPYPPMHLPTFVGLAVREKAPFRLAVKLDPPQGVPGGTAKVTITAMRDTGFDDEITLSPPAGLPPTVPAPKGIPPIGKGKSETSFALDLNAKTPLGEYFLMVTAKSKEHIAAAPPILLELGLPFDLQVEPASVKLDAGGKAKIKVSAMRKGGYKGPIALDVRNLPAGVSAAKAVIAADKNDADIELTADAKAAPVTASATIGGTATALNNLQNASPAFTVSVQKK